MTWDRRELIKAGLASAAGLVAPSLIDGHEIARALGSEGPKARTVDLKSGWKFGRFRPGATAPSFNGPLRQVSLPHCVTPLPWNKWKPSSWQDKWIYRRWFRNPAVDSDSRVFLDFERSMAKTSPVLNGERLGTHRGGYVPFSYEITDLLRRANNLLAVKVDGRWINAPPGGSPGGPTSIDFLQPAGLYGKVSLRVVPKIFIADVVARTVDVLGSDPRVNVICELDASFVPDRVLRLKATLKDGARVVASTRKKVRVSHRGSTHFAVSLSELGSIELWDVENPKMYQLEVALYRAGRLLHVHRVPIGFRHARFREDGFYLNWRRLQLFGLNRHQLFPFTGMAMPDGVQVRDALILRHQLNCNFVRCSHYPQSPAFLDACDRLGLLVWEEAPGFQYIGDPDWKRLVVRDVRKMVKRDRNHPSIVVWGVRLNETDDDPKLYRRTEKAAKKLDPTRPTSGGARTGRHHRSGWIHDVYGQNDYARNPDDGSVRVRSALRNIPYLVTESVGQRDYKDGSGFDQHYRRNGDPKTQYRQALFHAQAHDRAGKKNISGLVAWCAFDYQSRHGSPLAGVKRSGIMDCFREKKLGASIYLAQIDPAVRPVIEPNFYWYFGPELSGGPGKNAMICSNCDRLEVFVDGEHHATVSPARDLFPRLPYAPSFVDLSSLEGAASSELRIDGYVGSKLVTTKMLSADETFDHLRIRLDDRRIRGNGVDATRLALRIVDRYGNVRGFAGGLVDISKSGPAVVVGDDPFNLSNTGGAGAVWIRSRRKRSGIVGIRASHSNYGSDATELLVT